MTFKIGDIVRLKSGGPAMVVGDDRDDVTGCWSCSWISVDGTPWSCQYESAALQLVVPEVSGHVLDTPCQRCGSSLMFSARARGDDLCGPCSRGSEFKVTVPLIRTCERCISDGFATCLCAFDVVRPARQHVPPAMPALAPDEHERATADLRPLAGWRRGDRPGVPVSDEAAAAHFAAPVALDCPRCQGLGYPHCMCDVERA